MEALHRDREVLARREGRQIVGERVACSFLGQLQKAGVHLRPVAFRCRRDDHGGDRAPQRHDHLVRLGEAGIGFLDDRAEIAEGLRGLFRRGLDLRIELLHVAEPRAPRDAQTAHAAVDADAIVGRGRVPRGHVAHVGAADHGEHQRGVGDRARQRPDMGQDAERRGRVGGDAAEARLDAEHAGEGGRNADRAGAVGADMQVPEIEQRGGGRAAGGAAGRAVELPRVARDAGERRVAHADPAELGQRGLAEDDGAALAQPRDRRRIVLHRRRVAGERAAARGKALEPDIVLHGRAEAVREADRLALLPARLGGLRGFERAVAVHDDERVDRRLEPVDAVELVARDLDRRQLAAAIEAEQFGGGQRFDVGHGVFLRTRTLKTCMADESQP